MLAVYQASASNLASFRTMCLYLMDTCLKVHEKRNSNNEKRNATNPTSSSDVSEPQRPVEESGGRNDEEQKDDRNSKEEIESFVAEEEDEEEDEHNGSGANEEIAGFCVEEEVIVIDDDEEPQDDHGDAGWSFYAKKEDDVELCSSDFVVHTSNKGPRKQELDIFCAVPESAKGHEEKKEEKTKKKQSKRDPKTKTTRRREICVTLVFTAGIDLRSWATALRVNSLKCKYLINVL